MEYASWNASPHPDPAWQCLPRHVPVAKPWALLNSKLPTLNTHPPCFQTLAHSFAPSRKLSPVFSYTYKLLLHLAERQLHPLQAVPHSFAKTPGCGVPLDFCTAAFQAAGQGQWRAPSRPARLEA